MAHYTLNPKKEHGVSARDALKQFGFFLTTAKNPGILSTSNGLGGLLKDLRTFAKRGGMETGALINSARKEPHRTAIIDDFGTLTYKELWESVVRFALALQSQGVDTNSNIAVLVLNSRAAVLPLCARTLLGYNIFMINANSSGAQIERVLEYHEINHIIVDAEFYDRLTPATLENSDVIIAYEDSEHTAPAELPRLNAMASETKLLGGSVESALDHLPKHPGASAHVVMTSGTTGMPKGVVRLPKKNPQSMAPVFASIPWRRNLTVMLTGVLFHFYGWGNLVLCLHTASTVVMQRHYHVDKVLAAMDEHGVNAWITAASRLRALCKLLDDRGEDRRGVFEFICSSGSPLTPFEVAKIHEKFGPVLHSIYGSTESAAIAVSRAEDMVVDPTLSGTIYPGSVVKILDDNGNEVPEGELGEIYVADYTMFNGYTDPSIKITLHEGLLRMGDRGYRKGNKLYVKGRADDLVITQFGEKIFPNEVEDTLLRDSRVADVCVLGVQDADFGQALRAYVVRDGECDAAPISADEVCAVVRDDLSEAHVPRDVVFVDGFPRNPMGKVIRHELPEPEDAASGAQVD